MINTEKTFPIIKKLYGWKIEKRKYTLLILYIGRMIKLDRASYKDYVKIYNLSLDEQNELQLYLLEKF